MFPRGRVLVSLRLPWWQSLEGRHVVGDVVIGLLVYGVDRQFRSTEQGGIVERADLEHYAGNGGRQCRDMRATIRAEFPGYGALEIAAHEFFRRTLGVAETLAGHQHERVGQASAEVLAFAAMTLRLHHWVAFGLVAQLAAIASTFQFHVSLPWLLPLLLARVDAKPWIMFRLQRIGS